MMKRYRIRENSPMAWIRDLSIGGLIGAAVFGLFLVGLHLEFSAMGL